MKKTTLKLGKSTSKLAIRHETIRALAQLDLAQIAGGQPDAQLLGTGGPATSCPFGPAVPPKQ